MKKMFLIVLSLIVLCVLIYFGGLLYVFPPSENCDRGIRAIAFVIIRDSNNFTEELDWRDKINTPDCKLICPVSRLPYIYSPVAPCGKRMSQKRGNDGKETDEFVLWCPTACHNGKRNFLFSGIYGGAYDDNEVSWYYQRLLSRLAPNELEQEKLYRVKAQKK